jgi:hypothetical protein
MSFGKLLIGALLVGIGVVFLGTSLGYVPRDVWPSLLQYWPLLLVAVGVAFLANAIKNIVLGWLAVVIVVGGLLLGAWWFTTHQPKTRGSGAVTTIDLANPPVDAMTLRVRAFLGRIVVGSGAGRALRLESLHVPEKMRDAHRWTVTGRSGILEWPGESGAPWTAPIGGEFHASLPEQSPVRLDFKAQLSTLEADLAKLRGERITLEAMGCSVRLTASDRSGPQRIRLKGVLTDARLRLPADAPVRVIYHSWFGLRAMPADFIEHVGGRGRNQIFTSEGRGQPIEIEIVGPLLRIQIERAPSRAAERADSAAPGPARSEHASAGPRA